ncbi:hypothetical protein KIPB_004493, partial [Kipferlia bialata]
IYTQIYTTLVTRRVTLH